MINQKKKYYDVLNYASSSAQYIFLLYLSLIKKKKFFF